MKIKVFVFIFYILFALDIFSQSTYDAYKQLEIEKKYGIPVEQRHFLKIDIIMKKLREEVPVKEINDTNEATEICRKLYKVFVDDLSIRYHNTELLSNGLDNMVMDYYFLSLMYHTFLSKIHNFNTALIQTPEHIFLRWYVNENTWINFETLSGETLSDNYYIEKFKISKQAINNKLYMVPLSPSELESYALVKIANSFGKDYLNLKKSLYKKAFQIYPKLILATNNLALISVKEGNHNEALNWLHKSIALDSLNYTTYTFAGDIYKEIKNYEKALYYYNKAIAVADNNPSPYIHRSECYLDMGEIEKAMQDFELAKTRLKEINTFTLIMDFLSLKKLEERIMNEYLKKFDK